MSKKTKPAAAKAKGTLIEQKEFESPEQRRVKGKALREAVSRESHSGWKAPKKRHNPIKQLIESNKGRIPALIPIRLAGCSSHRSRLSEDRLDHGQRSVDHAQLGNQGAGLRRCPLEQLRRLCFTRGSGGVRYQRSG